MKKLVIVTLAVLGLMLTANLAQAGGCYICSGGSYVKFSGSDSQAKRKAAKACGCKIGGTKSSCDAANNKILCSVKKESKEKLYLSSVEE